MAWFSLALLAAAPTVGFGAPAPEATRPPDPGKYCWNDGTVRGPSTIPRPFMYKPFAGDFSQAVWTSVMDHQKPDYTRDGTIAALGEVVTFSDHGPLSDMGPTLRGGSLGTTGTGYQLFDYTQSPATIPQEYILGFQSPTLARFEYPVDDTYVFYDGHDGHDFGVSGDALAVAPGVVAFAGDSETPFGRIVDIYHPQGYISRYAHLASTNNLHKGDPITRAGAIVGQIGGSATYGGMLIDNPTKGSWPVHLHFSVFRWNSDRSEWEVTDPFGWDPWKPANEQWEDPLVKCNGEISYDLWVGGFPTSVTGESTRLATLPAGQRYLGGWFYESSPDASGPQVHQLSSRFGLEPGDRNGSARCGPYSVTWTSPELTQPRTPSTAATVSATTGDSIPIVFKEVLGDNTYRFLQPRWCGDILRDGSTAIAYTTYSGGAHCCTTITVALLQVPSRTLLTADLGNEILLEPKDIENSDGPMSLAGSSDVLTYLPNQGLNPFMPLIYDYRDQEFVENTRSHPAYLQDKWQQTSGELDHLLYGDDVDRDYIYYHDDLRGTAAYLLGVDRLLGRSDTGLAALESRLPPEIGTWLAINAAEIVRRVDRRYDGPAPAAAPVPNPAEALRNVPQPPAAKPLSVSVVSRHSGSPNKVTLSSPLVLEFNDSIDPSTFSYELEPADEVIVSVDSTGRVITMQPTTVWRPNVSHKLIIRSAFGVQGFALTQPFELNFEVELGMVG